MKMMKTALLGITAAAVLTVGGGTALAATYWEMEPQTASGLNDSQSLAEPIAVNDDILGYITNPSDRDFYKFKAPINGWSRIHLDKIPFGANYELRVFDPVSGMWLAAPQPGNTPETISLNLFPGQIYYAAVYSPNGSFNPQSPYHLRVYM